MEDNKKMKIIAFTFCGIAILLLILVIILPIIVKSSVKSSYTEKATPKLDNTNLWANFPGEVKAKTNHTFNILDYSGNSPKIKDSLILEENIVYDNFKSNGEDKLSFDAKSKYVLSGEPKKEKIKTYSVGMFETFETFSNPPKYQIGANSLGYLLNKAFTTSDLFLRQIFTYSIFNNLNEEDIRSKILKDIPKEKADNILSNDAKYSEYTFKNITGFYKWVKILGLPDEIKNAKWLTDKFELNETEIDSIFGEDEYLYKNYIDFNKELSTKFNCTNKDFCGNEIIYRQLISGEVLKFINLENGIKSLYDIIEPGYYPFSDSPELNLYFEKYKKNLDNNAKYTDYSPALDQLTSMLDSSSKLCLLSSNNSALFLILNETQNYNKMFKISENTYKFMYNYIYEYLPTLFLNKDISNFAKAYITITQGVMERTYKMASKVKGIYNSILSNLVWESLLDKISLMSNNNLMKAESDEICPLIMQRALDDGKKVLKVCSDPKTSFDSPETLFKWISPYHCIIKADNETCDMSVINDLKSIIYISDSEIKNIYDKDLLGGILEESDKFLNDSYKCGKNCQNDEYMLKRQFWKSELSLKLPSQFKNTTISQFLPNKFPIPFEIPFYAEKLSVTDESSEDDINELISLCPKGDNVLSEESSKALETKIKLEKEYNSKLDEKERNKKYKTFDILINGYLFNNDIKPNYKNMNDILYGNSDEDNRYIEFLSSGKYFENYKPKLNQTTGFNFGIGKDMPYDRYEIYSKLDEDNNMRKILSINDYSFLNIKKLDYNYLLNDYSVFVSPIMNFQSLTGDKFLIDGFQYDVDDEDKEIYFYDKISSRPFKFKYVDDSEYQDIDCKKYELDKEDFVLSINEENDSGYNKAFLTQKLNKPFIVSVGNSELTSAIDGEVSEENYMCIDPFTNMVLDSKINFVYSIYTKKYGYINPKIENDKTYPIFTYNRNYEVDIDSYNEYFPGITSYYTFRLVFIVIGIILMIVCAIISIWAFLKIHKAITNEEIQNNISEDRIVENSRITENK